jgi:hypothetical protein
MNRELPDQTNTLNPNKFACKGSLGEHKHRSQRNAHITVLGTTSQLQEGGISAEIINISNWVLHTEEHMQQIMWMPVVKGKRESNKNKNIERASSHPINDNPRIIQIGMDD